MRAATVLVMAKAPVPGAVKTRLGATVGAGRAALLAHAALLDTLTVGEAAFPPGRRVCALAGAVEAAVSPQELRRALRGWTVVDQVGPTFAHRLATAHRAAHAAPGGPVVQLGMDTPHVTVEQLVTVADAAGGGRPVLGPALDGGWWVLATTHPREVDGLHEVPMSTPDTGARTLESLERTAASVLTATTLGDVDTADDAAAVAAIAPHTRFARAWHELVTGPTGATS